MRRLPKTHKKLPMKKEDEPDFYKMDKEGPLPPLEEIPLSNAKMQSAMRGQQPLAFSPVPQGQGMQRPIGLSRSMYPEGVASHESYDGQDGGYMGGRGQSPTALGGNGMNGMRDPTNFKNMEFKPATMDPMGAGFGNSMGSQMMGPQMGGPMGAQMMGGQMNPQMMGQMMPGQMGGQMMHGQMGGQMMPGQMGGQMMPGQMGGQMMPGQMMGGQMMGGQMMNPQMMSPQMGAQMGASPMGQQMAGGQGGNQFQNLQRLRQYQQMQLFDRGMNPMPVGGGGEEPYGLMGASRPYC
jgi:hypothetical protein